MVFGKSLDEHDKTLEAVLQDFFDARMKLSSKPWFDAEELTLLGYGITT